MNADELNRKHPKLYIKSHWYAWQKTCDVYDRHDGYLSYEQLKLYEIIRQAWLAGHGIDYEITDQATADQVSKWAKYYHF